ncbi:MAG TPA: hypothetical protein VE262_11020, partial [Blastocatellia bacterium]|nr:hypothetical protein [Blastocatellia bacterium]
MRKAFVIALALVILSPVESSSQRRRRAPARPSERVAKAAAEKTAAELQLGRERLAQQVKTLSQFLYLLGGITKGIESADQASRDRMASSVTMDQNQRNKAKVRESIRNVRQGLEKLEMDFRINPVLKNHYMHVVGVAGIGEAAETQAAADRFDEAGRSLLKAVNQLADALAA